VNWFNNSPILSAPKKRLPKDNWRAAVPLFVLVVVNLTFPIYRFFSTRCSVEVPDFSLNRYRVPTGIIPYRRVVTAWVWNTLKGAQEMITGAREHDAALCFQRFSPFREIDLGVGNHKVWLDETGNLQGWCLSKIPVVKTDLYRFAWLKWKIQDGERLGADPSPLVYGERFPHRLELAEIDKRDNNSYRYSSDFQNHFSPWRLIGATLAALLMLCWGWVNLRQELRSTFGFLTFVVGGGLWVQAASGWLGWSSRL